MKITTHAETLPLKRSYLMALLIFCLKLSTPDVLAGGDTSLKVFMPTKIPAGSAGPLFTVYSRSKDQTMVCEAYYTKAGIPKGPKSMAFLNMKNPLKSFKLTFNTLGAPTTFIFADGSKITLTEKNGGRKLEMKIYSKMGRLVMSNGNIIATNKSTARYPAGSFAKMIRQSGFISPFRIRWEDVGDFNREDLVSSFGAQSGNSLGDFLDHSTDLVNNLIERVTDIALAGPSAGAKVAVVAEGFISDGLGILADRTKSKSIGFIQTAYDLRGNLKNIDDFFNDPSLEGVTKLVNGIEDTIDLIKNQTVDLAIQVQSDPPEDGNHLQDIKFYKAQFDNVFGLMGQPYTNESGTLSKNVGYFSASARSRSLISSIRGELAFISPKSEDYESAKSKLDGARSTLTAKLGNDLILIENKLSELRQARTSIVASLATYRSLLQTTTDSVMRAYIQQAIQDTETALAILNQHESVMVVVRADIKSELESGF